MLLFLALFLPLILLLLLLHRRILKPATMVSMLLMLLPSVTVAIGADSGKGHVNKKKTNSHGLDCASASDTTPSATPTSAPSKDLPVTCDNGVNWDYSCHYLHCCPDNGATHGNKKKTDSNGLDCAPTPAPSKDLPVTCDNGVAGTTPAITSTAADNGATHGNKKKTDSNGLDCAPTPAPSKDLPVTCDNGVAGTTPAITSTAADNGATHGNKKKTSLDCIPPPVTCDNGVTMGLLLPLPPQCRQRRYSR